MTEPVVEYIPKDGSCNATNCYGRPYANTRATHILTFRDKPSERWPDGLLTRAAYCHNDAMWFCGAQVAMYGATFISLEEIRDDNEN